MVLPVQERQLRHRVVEPDPVREQPRILENVPPRLADPVPADALAVVVRMAVDLDRVHVDVERLGVLEVGGGQEGGAELRLKEVRISLC